MPIERLCNGLGHRFQRRELLMEALTHPSASAGRGAEPSGYERLEFLGDRVLGLVIAQMLIAAYPREKEGALARRHAALVRREALARVADSIGLPEALVLARGEEEAGGRHNPALLADACEAVIGALFADAGFETAAEFIRRHWQPLMAEALTPPKDAKTSLQEWAQARGLPLPAYETVAIEGRAHEPTFRIAVRLEGMEAAEGTGPSKRVAEQAAAAAMLRRLPQ